MAKGRDRASKSKDPFYDSVYLHNYLEGEDELCPTDPLKSNGLKSFEETYKGVSGAIRLGEVAKLADENGLLFERTFAFRDYINYPEFRQTREHCEDYIHHARKAGLISESFHALFPNPNNDQLKQKAFQRLHKSVKIQDPYYINHINFYLNVSAFNAIMRVYDWVFREPNHEIGDELKSDPIYREYHNKRLSDRIDHFGTTKPSAEKAQEALDWLADLDCYFNEHEDRLDQVVAQTNVKAGFIDPSCKMSRDELLDHIYESKTEVRLTIPSVVSLYSRERYLGEKKLRFQGDGRSYNIQEINELVIGGRSLVGQVNGIHEDKNFKTLFGGVKSALTEEQIVTWNLRLEKFDRFINAIDYWDSNIHWIGIDWNKQNLAGDPPYKSFDDCLKYLDDLIQITNSIENWISEKVFNELLSKQNEADKNRQKRWGVIRDYIAKPPYGINPKVIKKFTAENNPILPYTKATSEVLDKFINATKDLEIKEPKVKEGKAHIKIKKPSAPKGVKAEILPDPKEVDLVAGLLEDLSQDSNLVHQPHVVMFFGLYKEHPTETEMVTEQASDWHRIRGHCSEVAVKNKSMVTFSKHIVIVQRGDSLIRKIFNKEHSKKVTKPITHHPIYQKFIRLWDAEQLKPIKDDPKFLRFKGLMGQVGVEPRKMAKWLLTNLPKATKERIEEMVVNAKIEEEDLNS